eukprot:jgi/Astpho2/3802/e_gw1.00062.176.1_t
MGSLHHAARNGDLVELSKLLAAGAAVDEKDKHLRTPLHMAAWSGQVDCLNTLIGAGAKVMQPASDDVNALHFAAQKGHLEVCRALLNEGEPVHIAFLLCSRPSCIPFCDCWC